MSVLHWWFVTAPVWIWHAITPLGFGQLVLGAFLYVLYAAGTAIALILCGYVLLGVAAVLKAFGRSFRDGYRKSSAR